VNVEVDDVGVWRCGCCCCVGRTTFVWWWWWDRCATAANTTNNTIQSTSVSLYHLYWGTHTDIDLKRAMLPSSLLLSELERESVMLPLMIQSPLLDLSFQLCYQAFIEYQPALSLTKREKHQHSYTKLKPFNDSRARAICSCEYEQALFYLPLTHANRSLIDALWYLIWTLPLWYLHHCVWECVPQCQWVWVRVRVSTNFIHAIKQPLARDTHSINHSVSIRLINR